jgi:hypothetical protein
MKNFELKSQEKNIYKKIINKEEYINSTKERDDKNEFIKNYQLKNKNRASTTNSSLK